MLTRQEIEARAAQFAEAWKDAQDEAAEAKSFWDSLFLVYGTPRRNVARFEHPVRRPDGSVGKIDLFWKQKLLVEHKSRGRSLSEARRQAQEYILDLPPADRPKWLVVSDFQHFEIVDQETGEEQRFELPQLPAKVDALGFIGGFSPKKPSLSAPVNIKAVELLGDVFDTLRLGGYPEDHLPAFLVRLLFALFAEDTAIFEPEQFRSLILDHSDPDGSDLGRLLDDFFQVLNTPPDSRQVNLPAVLAAFPYVNGALFGLRLPNAAMTRAMRDVLLRATEFDWTQISPAIFGSLFQSVMDGAERRSLGAHYTSEDDILKLIRPLFLDELEAELEAILRDATPGRNGRLDRFHARLAGLKFLDPACGCGNFLIIAYRELRRLETRLLVERYQNNSFFIDIELFVRLNVDAFFGIEIEEFPAEIARVGLWLMDHICNRELAAAFGASFVRLPLKKSATIRCGNALTTDWASVLPPDQCSYVIGNPPFVGARVMSPEQKRELRALFRPAARSGDVDYVSGWYIKAADYVGDRDIDVAFVSTNSITQGEQVGVLWPLLFQRGLHIQFAHRTFAWRSEARGAAHVHVVIIGFSRRNRPQKLIFDHADPLATRTIAASNISPYLIDAPNTVVVSRSKPLCEVPELAMGNQPVDDGNYIFTEAEKAAFLAREPKAEHFLRRFIGGQEFLNGGDRWILWLGDCTPSQLRAMPAVVERIDAVRQFRAKSGRAQTIAKAAFPTRFMTENIPSQTYLAWAEVSSERRTYMPIGYVDPGTLASNKLRLLPNASLWHFGVLASLMHNAWLRAITGRLKSDYQYSVFVVYNNFIWPETATAAQRAKVEGAAQAVLEARARYPGETLAQLYDPNLMPADLLAAHHALDRAVDACYRRQPFTSEMDRVQHLFRLYEAKAAPLAGQARNIRKKPRLE